MISSFQNQCSLLSHLWQQNFVFDLQVTPACLISISDLQLTITVFHMANIKWEGSALTSIACTCFFFKGTECYGAWWCLSLCSGTKTAVNCMCKLRILSKPAVERDTVQEFQMCLSEKHNTLSPARARTWTTRSRVQSTGLRATTSLPHPMGRPF